MIVSWNWLKQYVLLDMPLAELEQRLMMSGLNHEGTEEVGGDPAIDLEVTSNRPDCLGHIGVAREIAVLWDRELKFPPANPVAGKTPAEELIKVRIDCPELCDRYTARVIHGAKVGPSPKWMVRRLATVGIASINNVVDISNYVMMECGQPLHVFDMAHLENAEIIVRRALEGETIEAIDHKTYKLTPDMCVIADASKAVAIGGVMGGAESEVAEKTTDLLIEAARFAPLAIRGAARALNLHSESSYRFERRIDPEGVDWASRRCCELIIELAGGELAEGCVDVGRQPTPPEPVSLRFSQIPRVLGIDVEPDRVREILAALGNAEKAADKNSVEVVPPSWRGDLTREIDLIEEVARIYGYDKIPEDVGVPMAASTVREEDRVVGKLRHVLTAAGYDEAVTLSVVDERAAGTFSPWTGEEPLRSLTPVLRGADRLRCSLIPSLLAVRRTNEALANSRIELFEIAKIYLPRGKKLPDEQYVLGVTSGNGFTAVKGLVEAVVSNLNPKLELEADDAGIDLLAPARSCRLSLDGKLLAVVGEVLPEGLKKFELRNPCTIAEIKLSPLVEAAELIPQYVAQSPYPAVARDLNLVVDEGVRWADVAATVRQNCGEYFEQLDYLDTYRDSERLGADKKSLLLSISLRWREGTMTNQQADELRDKIVAACGQEHGAELR